MIPTRIFLTRGVGFHRDKLTSFEYALRDAGIAKFNLVSVSSILPPGCEIITRDKGLDFLSPGEIVYVVMSRNESNERYRLISASVGLAIPEDKTTHGYLTEFHTAGMPELQSRDYVEDQAAELMASTLGISFNADKAWSKDKEIFKIGKRVVRTRSICQSVVCKKGWNSVVAVAVFVP